MALIPFSQAMIPLSPPCFSLAEVAKEAVWDWKRRRCFHAGLGIEVSACHHAKKKTKTKPQTKPTGSQQFCALLGAVGKTIYEKASMLTASQTQILLLWE